MKILIQSLLISVIGVFVIDYLSHLFFSNPMETPPYFMTKFTFYFVFSSIFLSIFNVNKKEFIKVFFAGIVISLIWGAYYNIFPLLFDYYPLGISLRGLTFMGMGFLGTGLAFGIVHILAFVGGYYSSKFLAHSLRSTK